jgi:transposase-like protein
MHMMHILTTCGPAASSDPFSSTMPRCPSCGEYVVAAQASEFIDTGEIRHHWACDDCGQAFSTTVTLD